ncbi:MAG: roadblock/LC7 domain-containing protein [Anaerolineae bacterium]|nr:roadblock/LC7 domain-containing protein [Anaerolineae bacterium]
MSTDNQVKDNNQLLKEVLDELTLHNPSILSALVVSDDGLNVASGLPHAGDDDMALTSSDLVDTATEFGKRFEQGRLNRILLEGEQRTAILMKAGKRTTLVVLITADEKLGLISQSMRRAVNQIVAIFG